MARLRDRNKFPPGGFKFYVAQTKWQPTPWSSFDSIVNQLIEHRRGNPYIASKEGWSTDYNTVAGEVDAYNSQICAQMGWNDFIMASVEGGQPTATPFPSRHRNRLRNVVAGSETLVEWITSGAEAVPAEQANQRASICATCPKNGKGDWTRFFTVPVANAIRVELEKRKGMNLSTPYDEQLNVCEACLCPIRLKVHVPISKIMGYISGEAMADLDPRCWILSESAK